MPVITLSYHDVVDDLRFARPIASGHTTWYTIDMARFREHMAAIRNSLRTGFISRIDRTLSHRNRLYLTVDDGAMSSMKIAEELNRLSWPGHFFITTSWSGKAGFLDRRQIRRLHDDGHLIGSHSCSHPARMSSLSDSELRREWTQSCAFLSDITGMPTTVASVPDGYFSRRVAEAAAQAGIRILFTSEPSTRRLEIEGCAVLGRYCIRRGTQANSVEALASGATSALLRQAVSWHLKKVVRSLGGTPYLRVRQMIASRQLQS